MANKRRRSGIGTSTPESGRKRHRGEPSTTPHPHGNVDPDKLYTVKAILDEDEDEGKYLIDWADDEETAKPYEPTWEPKANVTRAAVEEWEVRKAGNKVEEEETATAAATPSPGAPAKRPRGRPRKTSPPTTPAVASVKRKRGRPRTVSLATTAVQAVETPAKRPRDRPRKNTAPTAHTAPESSLLEPELVSPAPVQPPPARNRKIVESDPPEQAEASNIFLRQGPATASSVDDTELELEIEESDAEDPFIADDDFSPLSTARFEGEEVQVQLSDPPSSFLAGAYEKISSQTSSLATTKRSQSLIDNTRSEGPAPPNHSQVASTQSGNGTSLVIPDSQSQLLPEESSSFKGFSPEPVSRHPSTAQNEDFSQAEKSLVAIPDDQEGEPSADTPFAPDSAAANQVLSVADTTAGASEVGASLSAAPPDNRHGEQQNSPLVHGVLFIESQGTTTPAQRGQKQASSDALEDGDNFDTVLYPDEEVGDSSARGGPGDAIRSNRKSFSSQKSAANSGSVPEASQHKLLQNHTKGTSPSTSQQQSQIDHSDSPAPSNTQTQQSVVDEGNARQPIIVSSNEDHSSSSYSTLQPLSQSSGLPNYEPPPAGQKPPKSSAIHPSSSLPNKSTQHSATADPTSNFSRFLPSASQPAESQSRDRSSPQRGYSSTQQSSPFQTQIRPPLEALSTNRGQRVRADTVSSTSQQKAQSDSTSEKPTPRAPQESSFFPPIPSQSLGFLAASAPSQLETPEDMAKTPSPKEALLQLQNNGQPASSLPPMISAEVTAAQRAARLSVPPESVRSPSMVPAMEPSPEITKEEMNTSERYETLLPQAQGSSSGNDAHSANGESTSRIALESEVDPESVNVHDVPVGLFGIQRDTYLQNLWLHADTVKEFLQEQDSTASLLERADGLFDRLRRIVMHPDLVNPEALTQASTPERQAQWDCDASAKFRFLREFIERQADRNIHIAVIVRGQEVADMVEKFLVGSHVSCKKSYTSMQKEAQEQEEEQPAKSAVRATIVDLDQEAVAIEPADIVIAMDGLVQYQHPIVRAYRQHKRQAGMSFANNWAGLYILVAPRTIEHIERSMVPSLSRKTRARTLLTAIEQFRDQFSKKGEGQGQLPLLKQAAQDVVDYLDDPEAEWPLEPLGVIENLDSQTDTDGVSGHEGQPLHPQETNSVKRPLETADDELNSSDAAKRPRLESDAQAMPTTINPQDVEIAHVSDSLGHGTQSNLLSINEMDVSDEPSAAEQHMHEVFEEQQLRLEEHVKALDDLQYRHEDQRIELVAAKKERDGAIATNIAALERMRGLDASASAWRLERTDLRDQLAEANRKLLDHTVPERAEFEALRQEMERAKADRDKAEKRAQAAQKDLEYSRGMYQDCSNRARDLASEKTELEKELAVALARAEGEASRARQISQDNRHKLLERENAKLKAILQDREAGMKFRDEEITRLKEATRGRMGTRQSSVPRSPRVGSPIKGRMGAGSRQASPAAGDVRGGRGGHPLRRSD